MWCIVCRDGGRGGGGEKDYRAILYTFSVFNSMAMFRRRWVINKIIHVVIKLSKSDGNDSETRLAMEGQQST